MTLVSLKVSSPNHELYLLLSPSVLGAGQLAKMSAIEAYRLGIQVAAYTDRNNHEPMLHKPQGNHRHLVI